MFILDLERDLENKKPMTDYLCNTKVDTNFVRNIENNPILVRNILEKETKLNISWFLKRFAYKLKEEKYEEYLLRLLEYNDVYIQFKSCEILTYIYERKIPSKEYLVFINKFLINSFCYKELNQILNFIIKIINNLKNDKIKEDYLNDSSFINLVSTYILRRELQYNGLLIIWILSFDNTLEIFDKFNLIEVLPKVISERNKEKVLRVCFGLLSNLYKTDFRYNACITNELLKKIDICLGNTLDIEFIGYLTEVKEKIVLQQSNSYTMQAYFTELFANKLDETKIHYDDHFWEDNCEEISVKKVEIIKMLKSYLESENIKSICIAANDINMMLKVVPGSYFYVEKYKVKDDLFKLCTHENSDVKFYAIQALSSCILAEWK